MQYRDEHRRDSIKALPLSAVQQAFVTHASAGTMTDAVRDQLIHMLDARIPPHLKHFYAFEKDNIAKAMQSGVAPSKPAIKLPELSLLWAINLAWGAQKNPQQFYDSALWKQFAGVDGAAQAEKERLGFYIASIGLSGDTRLRWGKLGSSFYFDPVEGMINLDLILALGVGFDNAAAVAFHEIGHSVLTKGFGKKVAALDEQIEALSKKGHSEELTPEEYLTLQRLGSERHFRYMMADEAENNVVDRWTVNQGRRIRRDHALARNAAEATLVDGLLAGHLDNMEDTPKNRFRNVKHAIRYSFFRNNGYFPDTEKGWRDVGINPDWITTADGVSGMDALKELKELCGGTQGVENLQPTGLDAIQGKLKLAAAVEEYAVRRNQRIEEIYDRFIAHVVEPLLQQQQQQLQEEMRDPQQQHQPNQGQQGGNQQQSKQNQKENQPSKGQQEGGQQSGEQQQGDGKPQPSGGQKQGDGQKQDATGGSQQAGEKQSGDPHANDQGKSNDSSGKPSDKPEEKEGAGASGKSEAEKNGKKGQSEPGKGPQEEGEPSTSDAGTSKGERTGDDANSQPPANGDDGAKPSKPQQGAKVKVKGVGEMPDVEPAPQTPSPEMGQPQTPGEGEPEIDPGQSLDELENDRERRKDFGEEQDDTSSPTSFKPSNQQGFRPARGIGTSDVKSKPAVGNWSDYQAMVIQFSPQIRQQQQHIDQLRAKQIEAMEKPSSSLSLLPEDGDMARLDRGAHATFVKKVLRRDTITEDDAARFHLDKTVVQPSNMDIVLLLDGSDSMHLEYSASHTTWPFSPIQAAMHAGCVMNEACKNDVTATRGTRFYMGLWGNATPMMLIKPNDNVHEIGKRIAGVKQSHGWGTNLAPSITNTTAQLADGQKAKSDGNEKTGYSHYIIVSDGGIADENASFQTISRLLDNCPLSSVDFMIIENGKTTMDTLADKLVRTYPGRVAKHHHKSPATAVAGMETLLLDRMMHTPVTDAVSLDVKRRSLERANEAMKR